MNIRLTLAATIAACMTVIAIAAPWQTTISDPTEVYADKLVAYQANAQTYYVQLKVSGTAPDMTGYDAAFWWTTATNTNVVVVATCAWLTQSSGLYSASFTPADLNTNGSFYYGVGYIATNTTNRTVQQIGEFEIKANPYVTTTQTITWTTNSLD